MSLLSLRGVDVSIGQYSVLHGVTFDVPEGGVFVLLGRNGAGKTTTLRSIMGLWKPQSGQVMFRGENIAGLHASGIARKGIAFVPENMGIFGGLTVAENMVLNRYYDETISRGVQIDWQQAQRQAAEACMKFDVRTPNVFLGAGSLSGGNQQKMVVARELERPVKLVVASQPTRGVDVGSIEFIHQQLVSCCEQGNGVLIISSELDEILDLSDRIYVMFEGRITAEFDNRKRDADRNAIGLAMAGAGRTEAA